MAGIDSTLERAILASWGLDDPDLAGELVILAEVQRYNIGTAAVDVFYAATDEFATGTGDSPANQPYEVCLRVPSYSQSILNADWQGSAGKQVTQVQFDNVDGRVDADFARATYSWRGREIAFYGGLKSWARSAFKPIFGTSRVMDVQRSPTEVTCPLTPLPDRPDKPMQPNVYGGFGGAYDFAATADVDLGDVYNFGLRDFTISVRFKTSATGINHVLFDSRGSLSSSPVVGGVLLLINSSDQIRFRIDDGTTTLVWSVGDAAEFTDDVWHTVTVTVTRGGSGEVIGYVDGAEELASSSTSTVTGHISSTTGLYHGALGGATNNFDGEVDEPRVWYRALTADEASNFGKMACDGVETGLVGCWNYDEYGGTDIFNIVEGPGLVQAVFGGAHVCSMGTSAMDPGSGTASANEFTLTGWMRCASGASGVIASRQNASGSIGYAVRIDGSGNMVFDICDGSTTKTVTMSGNYDDSTLWGWAMAVDWSTDVELKAWTLAYPRATLTAGTPTDITGLGAIGGGAINFKLCDYDGGGSTLTCNQSWVFYTPTLLDAEDVAIALSEQATDLDDSAPTVPPTLSAAAAASGAHFYPLDENTGLTATDQIGAANGTMTLGTTWVDRDGDLTSGASGAWTSSNEGNFELKGTSKPVALGRPQRLLPVLVDEFFLIYQYSDPALGATQEIELVQSGALDLTGGGTDYTGDTTNNIITMAAAQDQPITMNVKGVQSGGAWIKYPGECVDWAWQNMAGIASADIESASITAYDEAHPYQCAFYFGSAPVSFDAFNEYMVQPDGFSYRNLSGKFALGSRVSPSGETTDLDLSTFDSSFGSGSIVSMTEEPCPPPTWMVRIAFDRTWYVHNSFLGGADEKDKRLHQQEFRYVTERQDEIKTNYPDALSRTYNTPYHKRSDAALLVKRMLTLDGTERYAWRIDLGAYHYGADIEDIVEIGAYSRYDVASTKFQVAGYTHGQEQGASRSQLVVWG